MTSQPNTPETGYYPTGPSVPEGRTSQGVMIDPLMVVFRCPKCGYEAIEDAYRGPVSCQVKSEDKEKAHPATWMEPITIVKMWRKDETVS